MKFIFKRTYYKRPIGAIEIEQPTPIRLVGVRSFWRPNLAFSAQQKHANFLWWRASLWYLSCACAYVSGCYLIYVAYAQLDIGQELTNISTRVVRVGERCTFQYTPVYIGQPGDLYDCPELLSCRTHNHTLHGLGTYDKCTQSTTAVFHYLLANIACITWVALKIYLTLMYFPHFGTFGTFFKTDKDLIVGLKQAFREIVVNPVGKVAVGHSHPDAAIARNVADEGINTFIRLQGLDVYSVQMSQRDVAASVDGSLIHYHLQDQHMQERSDPITQQHVVKLCNVDYYINWLDYLWMAQPFMLFTFTPEDPCGSYHEYKWTTNNNNTITMDVSGGATYHHPLWNYNVDHFSVTYPGVTITYSVEINRIYKHWSYVLLCPMSVVRASALARPSMTLQRQQLIVNATTIATIEQHKKTMFDSGPLRVPCAIIEHSDSSISVARPGEFSSITISSKLRSTLNSRIEYSQFKLGDLSNLLSTEYGSDQRFAAATIYTSYPYNGRLCGKATTKYSQRDLDVSYGRSDPSFLPELSLTGTVLCSPVIDNGFLPWRSKLNEKWTREERIENIRNVQVRFLPKYLKFACEFAKLIIPHPSCQAPYEVSMVAELQNRPTQIQNNLRAARNMDNWIIDMPSEVKSFQKSEVYPGLKDPRNISTLPSEHCLIYSTFTLPFTNILKTTKWYIFGKHPNRVAEDVTNLCARSKTITETDFSRFDGTHSLALYKLELALLLRTYHPCHHKQIRQVHASMVNAGARMTLGTRYEIGGSRLSGSADTSCMNSIDNAFVSYCAYRTMGYSESVSYDKLGLYGGDDGLSGDIDTTILERVATDLGLRLKVTSRPSSDPTSLLGRLYPIPAGSPVNMADLPRQLAKLHVCPTRDPKIVADPWIGLYNKASGYYITDPHTPMLGAWCRTVLRLAPPNSQQARPELGPWLARLLAGEQGYVVPRDIALMHAARVLDCTVQDIIEYETKLESVTTCDQFMQLTPFRNRSIIIPNNVQVGGEVGLLVGEEKRTISPAPKLANDDDVTTVNEIAAVPVIPYRALNVQVPVSPSLIPVVAQPSTNSKTCTLCSGVFTITPREQVFMTSKGWKLPKRCVKCRRVKKQEKESGTPK
jgi:hypothetical protein